MTQRYPAQRVNTDVDAEDLLDRKTLMRQTAKRTPGTNYTTGIYKPIVHGILCMQAEPVSPDPDRVAE